VTSLRARVDRDKCRGHAQCVLIAPEVFELGDDDRARVLTEVVPPEAAAAVEDAVLMCPEAAIEAGQQG
jgi:ferredoxin